MPEASRDGGPRLSSHSNISFADDLKTSKMLTLSAAGDHATAAAATKSGLAVTTRMQHPVSSPINRMPGSDFKKNFFFKALRAEGPE